MSLGGQRSDGVPSNAELTERLARVETNVEHVVDTVDRIEESISAEQNELAEQVEDNRTKVAPLYLGYRLGKYAVPTLAAVLGTVAATGLL